jgi:glucose/arabinose dehydrogenase
MEIRSIALFCLATAAAASIASTPLRAQLPSNATVYASKLEGPRGLKFGPDGLLYVAEAGTGGTTSTKGKCTQVVGPIGPYVNGNTARISKIDKAGKRTTVASGFPSAQSSDPTKDTSGVADVAFLGGSLYAVLAGGGCSHGSAIPNAVVKVNEKSGEWKIVANLSSFVHAHPAAYPDHADFEPDGVFYSLISYGDLLYTVEPNHGQVFSITPSGDVKESIDISEAEGHIVPTSIVARDDIFYVGNLNTFPITLNASKILTLSKDPRSIPSVPGLDLPADVNKLKVVGSRAGFATVVAVDIGPDGLLYALELSGAVGYPTPGDGKVVRLTRAGEIENVVTGLVVPTGMTFGPDGFLYVSNFGAAPAGAGEILRISIP